MTTISYREWLWKGAGDRSGIGRFANWWLVLHSVVGVGLTLLVPKGLEQAANAVLLPLAGLLIGLSFAWGGSAQSLLQTREIFAMSKYHPGGGFSEYVYAYQTAILLILVTLVAWGLAGLGLFDQVWPTTNATWCYRAVSWLLYFLASLTVRECWHVVLGTQLLLLAMRRLMRLSLSLSIVRRCPKVG